MKPLPKHAMWAWLLVVCGVLQPTGCRKQGEDSDGSSSAPSTGASATEPGPAASASAVAAEASSSVPGVASVPPKPVSPPATNTAGANAVKACCSALNAEAKGAKAVDKAPYESAAAVCSGLVKKVETGAVTADRAKLTIRAQLQRARTIPAACK